MRKKKWIVRIEDFVRDETSSHIFDSKSEAERFLSESMADSLHGLGQDAGYEGEEILEELAAGDVGTALDLYEQYEFESVLRERFDLEEAFSHE